MTADVFQKTYALASILSMLSFRLKYFGSTAKSWRIFSSSLSLWEGQSRLVKSTTCTYADSTTSRASGIFCAIINKRPLTRSLPSLILSMAFASLSSSGSRTGLPFLCLRALLVAAADSLPLPLSFRRSWRVRGDASDESSLGSASSSSTSPFLPFCFPLPSRGTCSDPDDVSS
ncbi:hypothetical protein BU25DRAFT_254600 [Macroventuria anomochaeta]|uniref:Uncharacterized protein n=1 Tax=Macroventuria anomochaeta TaxID=301207 RepID=A0ACB6S7P2_9PLEO|nr:uncharacterized protein BU25DRAFT_254600 [Macroventuria anomochaeta]KAF2630226.1 hypothetical protein BU25DRAFT_254600 [Macroventuria anomochaeta]